MTYIADMWNAFILALFKPFVKVKENRMKLEHSIASDLAASQQRHVETLMDSQRELVRELNVNVKETTSVLREWLDGFHKVQTLPASAPPTNDDERMWRLEMQQLAKERGKALADNLSPYEIEAIVREGFNGL